MSQSRLRTIYTVELRLLRREQLLDDATGTYIEDFAKAEVLNSCEASTYSEAEAQRMYEGNEDDVGANEGECITFENSACEHGHARGCVECNGGEQPEPD